MKGHWSQNLWFWLVKRLIFGYFSVRYNRHILVGYNCHILVGYTRHILVGYNRHILVGYNRHILWSKFEKYLMPDIHDFVGVSFYIMGAWSSILSSQNNLERTTLEEKKSFISFFILIKNCLCQYLTTWLLFLLSETLFWPPLE